MVGELNQGVGNRGRNAGGGNRRRGQGNPSGQATPERAQLQIIRRAPTPETGQGRGMNANMLDLSGDARRTGNPAGPAQCALAAARNISRDHSWTVLKLNDGGYDQTTERGPARADGRGWEVIRQSESDATSVHWNKFLKEKCSDGGTKTVIRISPQITLELTTAEIRMITKAIIGENIGGGPGTHATVIHAAEDMGGGGRPVWHYLDNESTKHPEPRYLVATRIGEDGLRYKINRGQQGCGQ